MSHQIDSTLGLKVSSFCEERRRLGCTKNQAPYVYGARVPATLVRRPDRYLSQLYIYAVEFVATNRSWIDLDRGRVRVMSGTAFVRKPSRHPSHVDCTRRQHYPRLL